MEKEKKEIVETKQENSNETIDDAQGAISQEFASSKQGKKRSKGEKWRNKRKGMRKMKMEENRLCKAAAMGIECPKGESCKFSHSVEEYMQSRPQDFGDSCYVFEKYGSCPYGLLCRYGSSHIDGSNNVVDVEKVKSNPKPELLNIAPQELLFSLRKRSYSFQKSMPTDGADEYKETPLRPSEKKKVDFEGKLILPPLTTVGNLPFRRICKDFGVDITVGEMCFTSSLLQGSASEYALLKRHPCEDVFGIQVTSKYPDEVLHFTEILNEHFHGGVDFIDVNAACPIEVVTKRGCGAALLDSPKRFCDVVATLSANLDIPVTVKARIGKQTTKPVIHNLIPRLKQSGADAIIIHGRSWYQRYKKSADWDYLKQCASICRENDIQMIGNGDIISYADIDRHIAEHDIKSFSIARGALVKPWIFTEIKERRDWDISSSERLDLYKKFANYGLEHWGSDTQGVEKTRRFLMEWLGYAHGYIPLGVLDRPFSLNERNPGFVGRNELETLMASEEPEDWLKITEMVLAPAPSDYVFKRKRQEG